MNFVCRKCGDFRDFSKEVFSDLDILLFIFFEFSDILVFLSFLEFGNVRVGKDFRKYLF